MRILKTVRIIINSGINALVYIIKAVFVFLLFPAYIVIRILNPLEILKEVSKRQDKVFYIFSRRLFSIVFSLIIIFPIWNSGYFLTKRIIFQKLGFNKDIIFVAGTGSMYPTFPKGQGENSIELSKEIVSTSGMFPFPNGFVFKDKRYFSYNLQRGDIVVVDNNEIRKITKSIYGEESGWVKRLIGLPGDTIELRDGLVYLNKAPIREQYTALPRSTFGESFLGECEEVKVPEDSIFVMGDNRKGSGDSREIGFISIDSVNHVLPIDSQIGTLDKHWRDTTDDFSESSKIKIDKKEYLLLLNKERKNSGMSELTYQPKLEFSAKKRGETMLRYNDTSFEATRSGYTMEKAMRDSGYSNIIWGEIPTFGFYEASELVENQFEFPTSKEFLLEKDFDEVGISEVEGLIDGCPAQIMVLHFAGYVPPNYSKEYIESWRNILARLKEVAPSWQKLKEYPEFYREYKSDVDRINEIITIRIENISAIVTRIDANQWLTDAEKKMIDAETALSKEQDVLADKLNNL